MKKDEPTQLPDPGDDPRYWKWGIFYYNPDDPRLFPPKRIKAMGWTVNFANPYSVGIFIVICLVLALISIYLPNKK